MPETIGRSDRRLAAKMKCVHCEQIRPREAMSMLECGLPSDCCQECWAVIEERNRKLFAAPAETTEKIKEEPEQPELF